MFQILPLHSDGRLAQDNKVLCACVWFFFVIKIFLAFEQWLRVMDKYRSPANPFISFCQPLHHVRPFFSTHCFTAWKYLEWDRVSAALRFISPAEVRFFPFQQSPELWSSSAPTWIVIDVQTFTRQRPRGSTAEPEPLLYEFPFRPEEFALV